MMITSKSSHCHKILFALFLMLSSLGYGQNIPLPDSMYFRNGDNPAWAAAETDLSEWQKVPRFDISDEEWNGIGWIRMEVKIDSTLHGKTLAMYIRLNGAAEVYHNGKHVHTSGNVSDQLAGEEAVIARYPIPLYIPASDSAKSLHTFAVRYSAKTLESTRFARYPPYLFFQIAEHQEFMPRLLQFWKRITVRQTFLSGIFLIFALIHLFLFLYSPSLRANLAFAAFSFFCSIAAYAIYETRFSLTPESDLQMLLLGNSALLLLSLSAIAFIHTTFYNFLKKRFYLYVILIVFGLFFLWIPHSNAQMLVLLVESITLLPIPEFFICWIGRKRSGEPPVLDGGWIVGAGSLPMLGIGIHRLLELLGFPVYQYSFLETPLPFYGVLLMMLSMSILLARNVAKTTSDLQEQLQQVQRLSDEAVQQGIEKARLEAENERKSQELESARELQLSMLPNVLPEHPDFDIAVRMETASEVGGDYYDLKIEDSTLTAVVGDATGHGLKAGTMVAATKSLFNSLNAETDLLDFLSGSSHALKQMGFSQMYMALAIFRLNDRKLTITSAGMPFPLVYRAAEQSVEEIDLKGMPLGSFPDFPYKTQSLLLNKDDVLLLLSDGLSERFNEQDEQFGDEKIASILTKHASKTAADILNVLLEAGSSWGGMRALDDDCTIFVLKIR
ncbi:MAG: SpoIIE family protein phosphatase [Calditrichia bacterium]